MPSSWSPLFRLCLVVSILAGSTLAAGCPVYGHRPRQSQDCTDTTESATPQLETTCSCDQVKAILPGDPIPGMRPDAIPRRGGTLRIIVDSSIPGLNRLLYPDAWIKHIILHDVYQSLVRQDSRDYHFRPELAVSWSHNDLETVWTFKLRKGVRWHDGEPFTSRDVLFTFDALMNPNNRTEVARSDWVDILDPERGYEAPDDETFVIRLKRPFALLFPNLDSLTILPAHVFSRGDFNTNPANRAPVGTGPFRFVAWTDQAITLERNPDYWGRPAYLDRLVYRFVLDRDTAFSMVKRGDVDFLDRLTPYQRNEGLTPELLQRYRVIDLLPLQYAFWVYNTRIPQFADKRTRRAMTMLMNRKQILCEIYQCQGIQVTSPIPPHHPAYDASLKPYPYDPAAAAKLLTEAGWEDTDGDGVRDKLVDGRRIPFRFTFLMTQNSKVLEQMATIVQNAARRVGIDMRLSKLDWSAFAARLRKRDFDAASLIWVLNHDLDLYPIFHSQGSQNLGSWHNAEMDVIVDKARYIMDETIRNILFRRAHHIIYEEQPYTSTFVVTRPALVRRDIQGLYASDHWYQEYDMWYDDPAYPVVPPEDRHPGHPGAPPYDETGR